MKFQIMQFYIYIFLGHTSLTFRFSLSRNSGVSILLLDKFRKFEIFILFIYFFFENSYYLKKKKNKF
ncbi:hypothetical protein C1645_786302 [Glomus cerebriforme]|uniref:Uncharacterized protein n=1 Tax=Glomus cerebriforme TaxID=658196 RepID=A0A397SF21_9GLOM|nr:hypothetical protein C1645_786302 [Glomus cerebriforme]